MGNRANVIFTTDDEAIISPCIYLHWNGGPESIYAFLDELNRRKVRADGEYEAARFVQLVGEFMDQDSISGLSLGIMNGPKKITPKALSEIETDSGDHGFYVVTRIGCEILRVRRFTGYNEIIEMSEENVKIEEENARKHEYNTGEDSIANVFLKITGNKEILG